MDHQEKEAYYLEKQRGLVKQIKLTFADVEKIEFKSGSINTPGLGASTRIDANIIVKSKKYNLELLFPYYKEDYNKPLDSWLGNEPKEGHTKSKVKVIYENGTIDEV